MSWKECCSDAVQKISVEERFGNLWPKYKCTIRDWNIVFRKNEIFPRHDNPNKNKLPSILLDNPDLCNGIKTFGHTGLDGLTVEKMHAHIHDTLLPKITLNHRSAENIAGVKQEITKKKNGDKNNNVSVEQKITKKKNGNENDNAGVEQEITKKKNSDKNNDKNVQNDANKIIDDGDDNNNTTVNDDDDDDVVNDGDCIIVASKRTFLNYYGLKSLCI